MEDLDRQERGDFIKRLIYISCLVGCFFITSKTSEAKTEYNSRVYAITNVNIRARPTIESKSYGILYCGQSVKRIKKLKCGWSKVKYKNNIRYIKTEYLTKNKSKEKLGSYVIRSAPSGHHQKSYMDKKFITNRASSQYKLMKKSYVGKYGIIMYQGRYCVALGSYYCKRIGTKFDLVLKNGHVIKCVLGDQKANEDTDSMNIQSADGSITEFIVDTHSLNKMSRLMGDVSYSTKKWNSEVKYVKVYK